MSRIRLGPALAAALLSACGSVAPPLDTVEGDFQRDQANAVFIGRSITDRLDEAIGDHTDWKYVDVVEFGKLQVRVSVDQPEGLKQAEIEFFDEFGNRLHRYAIADDETVYVFEAEVKKIPNRYFIRIGAPQGQSVYTVGASQVVPPPPPLPPPPEEPKIIKIVQLPAKPPPGKIKDKPTPPPATPIVGVTPVVPVETATATAAGPEIVGIVVRVIAEADRQAVQIRIQLDREANGMVAKGAAGRLFKGGSPIEGGNFTVDAVQGRLVAARVALSPGKLARDVTARIQLGQ